jgi:hypothetical protein
VCAYVVFFTESWVLYVNFFWGCRILNIVLRVTDEVQLCVNSLPSHFAFIQRSVKLKILLLVQVTVDRV